MDKIRQCSNNCIFCFINQLPKDLRSSLYIKDDDYIESYQNGSFITLTNLKKKDIENIIKYNLSPLNISFHSADNKKREIIFGNKKHKKSIEILEILDKNKIKTNIQIVLCKDINDGDDLLFTLDFLRKNFKNILSVGIVPVGITRFNKNSLLKPYNKETSERIVALQRSYVEKHAKFPLFLSDEFYILAEIDFPEYRSYKKFHQIENGIGLSTNFRFEFLKYLDLKKENFFIKNSTENLKDSVLVKKSGILSAKTENILILTSEYAENLINSLIEKSIKIFKEKGLTYSKTFNFNFNINVLPVKNKFFGGNVKVCGLLTFSDYYNFFRSFNGKNSDGLKYYDKILIPDIIFNKDGITIDDKTVEDFKQIFEKIKILKTNAKSLLKELYKI